MLLARFTYFFPVLKFMVSMCGFTVNIFTDGVVNSTQRKSEKQNVKLLLWGSETVINCLMLTDGIFGGS